MHFLNQKLQINDTRQDSSYMNIKICIYMYIEIMIGLQVWSTISHGLPGYLAP